MDTRQGTPPPPPTPAYTHMELGNELYLAAGTSSEDSACPGSPPPSIPCPQPALSSCGIGVMELTWLLSILPPTRCKLR